MERGIIVSPFTYDITDERISFQSNGLSADKLRYYFVYWDKIAVTNSNIFYSPLPEEANFLKENGIIQECMEVSQFPSGDFSISSDVLPAMHFSALAKVTQDLTVKHPGQWTIHQFGTNLIIPPNLSQELVTVDIELNNCLPVPSSDISLDKISKFKSQRSDELLALRICLDELYVEISKSRDIPRAKNLAITKLESAIDDLNRVAKESWKNQVVAFATQRISLDSNVLSEFNLSSITQGFAKGTATASVTGNLFAGFITGAWEIISNSIKLEVTPTKQVANISGNQFELSYLSSLRKSGLIK
jgi:hypothetical protein